MVWLLVPGIMQLSFSNALSGLYKLLAFAQTVLPCLKREKLRSHFHSTLDAFVSSIAFLRQKEFILSRGYYKGMMCTSFNDVDVTKNRRLVEQAKPFLLRSFIYCWILNTDLYVVIYVRNFPLQNILHRGSISSVFRIWRRKEVISKILAMELNVLF